MPGCVQAAPKGRSEGEGKPKPAAPAAAPVKASVASARLLPQGPPRAEQAPAAKRPLSVKPEPSAKRRAEGAPEGGPERSLPTAASPAANGAHADAPAAASQGQGVAEGGPPQVLVLGDELPALEPQHMQPEHAVRGHGTCKATAAVPDQGLSADTAAAASCCVRHGPGCAAGCFCGLGAVVRHTTGRRHE